MTRKKKTTTKKPSDFTPNYYRSNKKKSKQTLSIWHKFLRLSLLIALLAVVSAGLYFTRVESVRVEGVQDESLKDDIKRQVADSNEFLWQIYTSDTRRTVDYPASVAGVDLKADWNNGIITAVIRSHSPELIWRTGESSFVIDERGFATSKLEAAKNEGTDSLPAVRDDSSLPVEAGGQVVPEEFVAFATNVANSGLPVEKLRIIDTSRELYADLDKGYFIRFDTTRPVDSQIDSVRRTQKLAERNNDVIEQYIDVRLQHKAYYR